MIKTVKIQILTSEDEDAEVLYELEGPPAEYIRGDRYFRAGSTYAHPKLNWGMVAINLRALRRYVLRFDVTQLSGVTQTTYTFHEPSLDESIFAGKHNKLPVKETNTSEPLTIYVERTPKTIKRAEIEPFDDGELVSDVEEIRDLRGFKTHVAPLIGEI